MPKVTRPIKEQHKSIIRPVVIDVVNQLMRFMELPADTDIIFKGYADIAMLPNGQIGVQARNREENIRTVGRNRIFIEFEEEVSETNHLEMPVLYPEQSCIFADNSLGITIRPVKKRSLISIRFINRFTSRALADQWHSNMEQLMARYVKDYVHEVTYNYAYPDEVINLMHELWKYREYQGGYDESFGRWLVDHSTKKFTAIQNQNGGQTDLVIGETADNVQGAWEFDTPPFVTKSNNLGSWQAEFSYKFEFDKTIAMNIQYPVMIHNQLLDDSMLAAVRQPSYRGKLYRKPLQQSRFEGIQEDLGEEYTGDEMGWLIEPSFDEWQLPMFDQKMIPQYQVLLQLNPDDLKDLVNLKELGPYVFTDRALSYLSLVKHYAFMHRQSIIQFVLFEDDDMLDPDLIEVDDQLNVRCKHDLDIRKQYHLAVYIDSDLRHLWERTVDDLKDRGVWTQDVVSVIWPDKVPQVDDNGRITDGDWQKLIDDIDWSKLPSTETLYIGRFTIIARSYRDAYSESATQKA